MTPTDLTGQVMLITGANAGIGKETARQLAGMGATVVMVARSQERGAQALAEVQAASGNRQVHLMLCDLSSQAAIRQLAGRFTNEFDRLDVLVNNAGAVLLGRKESVDGLEMCFAVNHMAYFLLTGLLLDMLKASSPARIVNVASAAHHGNRIPFDDLQHRNSYSGYRVYGQTKLMNIMFTYALHRRLEGSGVTVNAVHPGFVRTMFGRRNNGVIGRYLFPLGQLLARSVQKGAETPVFLASSPEVAGVSGRYFVDKKAVRSSPESYDEAAQERLWAVSESLINVDVFDQRVESNN